MEKQKERENDYQFRISIANESFIELKVIEDYIRHDFVGGLPARAISSTKLHNLRSNFQWSFAKLKIYYERT